ncbi:MAG: hypothetical protein JOZ96_26180 [Acidobacteria bacterium]|nr:hypothetical protein [Acidobacteriota bacterium]
MQENGTGKTIEQILRIIRAGGGVTFDASGKVTSQLVTVAEAAARAGVTVTLLNVGDKPTDQLERIASAGKGRVVLGV